MEWLILLLLVPAILVPIVLLCGFAGCSFSHGLTPDPPDPDPPLPPTVTATTKNVDHITVSWQNTDPNIVLEYRFVRMKGTVIQRDETVNASITIVEDTGLEAETDYTYEVSTITENGSSAPTTVPASTFKTAFEVDPMAVPDDQTIGSGNSCGVQRISAAQLLANGVKVGIKVRGSPAGNVTINRIYISRARPAGMGGEDWDSDTDLTQVPLPDDQPLTLPDANPKDLEPIVYSLDQTQDLIIAFDFTATPSAGNIRYVLRPGVTLYFKGGVQQASLPTRSGGYSTTADKLYLVVTIGVP